jgi:hypothetical protein
MPLFMFILTLYITYIYSITFVQYIKPSSFAEVHLLIAGQLSGKNLPGVSNSGLPYSKATHYQLSYAAPLLSFATPYWATPHPYWSTAHPIELRRTRLSNASSNWATPHPYWAMPHLTELRRTLTDLRRTLPSYAAPYWAKPHSYWATPHPTELRRTRTWKAWSSKNPQKRQSLIPHTYFTWLNREQNNNQRN